MRPAGVSKKWGSKGYSPRSSQSIFLIANSPSVRLLPWLPAPAAGRRAVPFDQSQDNLLQGVALRVKHVVLRDAIDEREEDERLDVRVFHPDLPEVVLQPTPNGL